MNNPFRIKALVVYDGIDEENATARALRALKRDLEESDVVVEVSQCICDAELIVTSDPTVQCALVYLDGAGDEKHRRIQHFLELLRSRSHDMPVFLMSNRTRASEIPAAYSTRSTTLSGYWKIPRISSAGVSSLPFSVTASLSCRRCLRRLPNFPTFTNIPGIRRGIPAAPLF